MDAGEGSALTRTAGFVLRHTTCSAHRYQTGHASTSFTLSNAYTARVKLTTLGRFSRPRRRLSSTSIRAITGVP